MPWLQSRAYVGAKWEQSNSDYFYDWSSHDLGEAMPTLADAVMTLPSTINATATSFNVTKPSGVSLPSKGGVWVSGNATGQAWEYIQYSSVSTVNSTTVTLSGALREPATNREHNGSHNAGATVRFWWQLDTMLGEFSIIEEMDDGECVINWSAEASGWKFPQAALRDGHLFIYQTRTSASAAFTNTLIGFIDARNSEHDYKRVGKWVVKIVSSAAMINRYRATGVRRGKYNIGRGASVTASPPLGAAWKERNSGDYVAAEPSFSGDQTTDGDKKTLWIGDAFIGSENAQYTGTNNDPTVNGDPLDYMITEIHLADMVGQPPGYRYIEVTAFKPHGTYGAFALATEDVDESTALPGMAEGVNAGDKIIFCENEERFREEHPAAKPAQIIDLSKIGKAHVLRNRSLAGGAFGIWQATLTQSYFHSVAWGTGSQAVMLSAHTGTLENFYSDAFPSPTLAVSEPGETMRYNYANSSTAANNWTVGNVHTPGYLINGNVSYALLELPPMGLLLAENITDSYTGAVRLTDGTMEATAGLAASGSIQIGDEIITYNNRTATTINLTARGASSTSAAAHETNDAVYVVESGLAIDAMPIRTIELTRVGSNVPKNVNFRTTKFPFRPRVVGEANYGEDYDFSVSVTGNTSQTLAYNLPATRRVRYLLIEFLEMSSNPSRPRVNEIRVIPDETYFDPSVWLYSGETASEMVAQILDNVGVPSGAIITNTTVGSGEHATANRLAWDVVTEYAAYAGLLISVGRDSKITVSPNTYLTGSSFTPDFTWTRENTVNIKALHAPPKPVAQVQIKWTDPDGATSGTVVYPPDPDTTGEVLEMAEQVYADEAEALIRAEKVYYRNKFPYSWIAESADSGGTFRPGEIHLLSDWQLNSESGAINRTCLVKSVDHMIQQSQNTHTLNWRNVVNLIEIERTEASS